jgi:hypothetical protein
MQTYCAGNTGEPKCSEKTSAVINALNARFAWISVRRITDTGTAGERTRIHDGKSINLVGQTMQSER